MTEQDEQFIRQLVEIERRDFWHGVARDIVTLGLAIAAFVAIWNILP